jgi:hypothetical protein
MTTRTITAAAFGLALATGGVLSAQTQETKTATRTQAEMKGGKNISVMGCLDRRENGDYVLTSIRDVRGMDPSRYTLISDDDLARHVGERVRIEGKTVPAGNGTPPVKSGTRAGVENDEDIETTSKVEGTAGALVPPFLGVKSLKTLASSCS